MIRRRAGMIVAWRALAQSVMDVRFIGITLISFNLLWFFMSLPIITLPSATGALYVVTRDMVHRRSVNWRDFFAAMKAHWFTSWRWGFVNLAAALLFTVNLWFYRQVPPPYNLFLTALLLGVLFIWLLIQMYSFPVLLEQEAPQVRLAMRNAFGLVLRHPFFTLTYALVTGVFVFMAVVVPYFWMIFTVALIFYAYNHAVDVLLQIEQGEDPFHDEEDL